MKCTGTLVAVCLLVVLVLVAAAAGAAQEGTTESGSEFDPGGVALEGKDVVDLKWDPNRYPGPPGTQFVRWELYRGGSLIKTGTTGDFYRDRDVMPDTKYDYELWVVREANDVEGKFRTFSASATTGPLSGTVYSNLELSAAEYVVMSVSAVDGAILTVGPKTTLKGYGGYARPVAATRGGWLKIDKATLERIKVVFGSSGNPAESGNGHVCDSHFTGGGISLYSDSQGVEVRGNTFADLFFSEGVWLHGTSGAWVQGNTGEFWIGVCDHSVAEVGGNTIKVDSVPVRVYGEATASFDKNTITTTGCGGRGVLFMDESVGAFDENHLENTSGCGPPLLQAEDSAYLIARRNTIIGGDVVVRENGKLDLKDFNVISGGGIWIADQGKGTIEQNTVQNGTGGFKIWGVSDYPDLSIRSNCIRNHEHNGLYVSPDRPTKIDVDWNYWGHGTGPFHAILNPAGKGDMIEGNQVILTSWHEYPVYCQDTPPSPPDSAVVTPSSGGTVTSGDGKVQVSVPPGAVDQDTKVNYQEIDPSHAERCVERFIILRLFTLEALEQELSWMVPKFHKAYAITVAYSDQDVEGIQEDSLKLYFLSGNDWNQVSTSQVNTQNNLLTATLDHMTVFAVMGEAVEGPGEPGGMRVSLPMVLKNY